MICARKLGVETSSACPERILDWFILNHSCSDLYLQVCNQQLETLDNV